MVEAKPSQQELSQARTKFASLDSNGNWNLSFEEMCSFLRRGNPGLTDRELRGVFRSIDASGNGKVEFDEFVDFLYGAPQTPKASKSPQAPRRLKQPAASKGNRGEVCDWCLEPLYEEVTRSGYRRGNDGSSRKTTARRFVRDGQISLRLPGLQETVTLHDGTCCKEDYIEAHALRCAVCSKPICDNLIMIDDPETGETINLHEECEEDYEASIQHQGRTSSNISQQSEFVNDGSCCHQCRQPFVRTGMQGGRRQTVTDAQTTLQLPGLGEAVTLHSDGDCVDRFVEEHALRCDHCSGPVVDDLRRIQLPWADQAATLHKCCVDAYAEENAMRCSHCREPITERGVLLRSGNRMHYLHAQCESFF